MQQQGIEEAQGIRTERQAEAGGEVAEGSSFASIVTGQAVVVRKNSAGAEVQQPRLNLIEGANVTITLADDPVNSEADITFALTGTPDVTALKVGSVQVVGAQEPAIADVAAVDATDLASALTLVNEIKTKFNTLLASLREGTGHGLLDA